MKVHTYRRTLRLVSFYLHSHACTYEGTFEHFHLEKNLLETRAKPERSGAVKHLHSPVYAIPIPA